MLSKVSHAHTIDLTAVRVYAVIQSFDAQFTNTTITADNVSYHGQILVVASTKLADGINPIQVRLLMIYHYPCLD